MASLDDESEPSENDIIEINAGGEIIQSLRGTLCLASGSMFSKLFSGRWDDSCARDSQGRVFLDHDPELIKLIVNHLRHKRIQNPEKPAIPPSAPAGKKDEFDDLLCYFGLTDLFHPMAPVLFDTHESNEEFSVRAGEALVATRDLSENGLQLEYTGSGNHFCAVESSLTASSGAFGSFWKVTINALARNGWIFLGIIGNLNATDFSYNDASSFGWAGSSRVFQSGQRSKSRSWTDFVAGECLWFHLYNAKLSMWSISKNEVFTIDGVRLTEPYVHFNFYQKSTKVTISSLSGEKRVHFLSRIGES